jgi:hypothetical protein
MCILSSGVVESFIMCGSILLKNQSICWEVKITLHQNLVTQLLSFHMGMERRYATFKTE